MSYSSRSKQLLLHHWTHTKHLLHCPPSWRLAISIPASTPRQCGVWIFNVLYHKLCSQEGHLISTICYYCLWSFYRRAHRFISVSSPQHCSFQQLYLAEMSNSIPWHFLGSDLPKCLCSNSCEIAHCQTKSIKSLDKLPLYSHWNITLMNKSWKSNWVPNPALLLRHC